MKKYFTFDTTLFVITGLLLITGITVFLSASFSTFGNPEKFKGILFNQLALGLGGGILLFLIMLRIPYEYFKKYAPIIFIVGIVTLVLVFVPQLGIVHGGARRWISILGISFQPVELAKYTTVIFMAAWFSRTKIALGNIKQGLLPFLFFVGIVGILLLIQPDTDSFLIIIAASLAVYFLAGAPWRDIGIMFLLGIIGFGGLVVMRPYLLDRVKVFLDSSVDALGSSYQVNQQLIAIGSGQVTGRGLGQSIQKFKYLPEPLGDSVFSVVGEEFGFIGSVVITVLYALFFFRGIFVASRIKDLFGKLTVVGIISIIALQAFLHIASNIAIFPLGGLPLLFMSHGGTALACTLAAMGIVLNISRFQYLGASKK